MKTVWLPCVIFAQLGFILGSLATRTCTPTSPFESQYLTPMCRQYLVGSGCYSSSVTTLQQEVHTIHVKNEDNLQRAEISLQIRPAADTGVYDKQLVFVLSSEIPVEWKVELLRLSLDFEIIFHVTRGSDVNYSEDRTITVIKKRHMPTVNDKLVRWIRRKYHALTSFTEIQKANKITLRVGAETMLSENCNIRSNFYSPNVVAEFLKVQPVTSGCAPRPVGSRAIHIIEANDSCVDGDTINLHVESQGREMYSNNVMIIIKSNVNTNWRVTSENFTGSLHIITNVDKMMLDDSPWQPDSSYEQTALESGAKLIRWAEKEHGPVNSFTETNNANLLRLQLKEDIVALPASETLMPEMIPKSPLDGDFNASDLMRSFTKECRDDGINVALQKDVLELFDVRFLSLSFLDHNCKAESNETHFILSTQFINCGTKKDIRDNRVVFKNAIVISDGEFTIEGSGWDFSDGSASGEILTDDEDMQILKIEFSCDYTTGPLQPVATRKPPLSFEITNYTLKLFDKYFYEQPHTEFPWLIEEDTRIYAQVGLEGALDLTFGVVPYGCWLSPTAENTRDVVTNELITNGCASDSSVLIEEFIPNDIIGTLPGSQKMPVYRFSFELTSKSATYLHCDITSCINDRQDKRFPQCGELQNCLSDTVHRYIGTFQIKTSQIVGQIPNPDIPEQISVEPPLLGESKQQPSQQIIIGLETGAVVGIAFAAFVIGVLLTAALWYIHTHTGPVNRKETQRGQELQQQQQQQQQPLNPSSQYGNTQGVTVNGHIANGTLHSYPYPSSLTTPMSAMSA